MDRLIYKIFTQDEWKAFGADGRFDGSAADKSDGYIHFSSADQLPGTLGKYYASEDQVAIGAFPADRFDHGLKWEKSRDGELFPHLYAPLSMSQLDHVEWVDPKAAAVAGNGSGS